MEENIPCKRDSKTGVAILITHKIDFKMKNILRDKEGHCIMIKGSIQEEDMTISNIYTPNTGSPQYIRQLLTTLKGENDNNTIIVGDFNTPLTAMDRSTRQKINKETQALNEALNQMDLTDIYRTFHPKATEYTFFSSALGTFSNIDHILGYKSNFSNFKKIEIISSIFWTTTLYDWKSRTRKKLQKNHKHMENKQHATKQPMDH